MRGLTDASEEVLYCFDLIVIATSGKFRRLLLTSHIPYTARMTQKRHASFLDRHLKLPFEMGVYECG
jgi:hypothetical protein